MRTETDAPDHPALVILDVDGTLVDSQHHIVEGQRRAFAACGLAPPTRAAALGVVGLSLAEAFTVLVGPDGPVLALCDAYKAAWTAMRGEAGFAEQLYPGAASFVAACAAQGRVLGIATGKSRAGVDRLLRREGWGGLFATVQTADDHPSKPHPSMLLTALRDTAVPAERAVMVGDTTFDMDMAGAAGVRPIGVAWGYHGAATLTRSGAAIVADFAALAALIGLASTTLAAPALPPAAADA